jgi:hypothetical protein
MDKAITRRSALLGMASAIGSQLLVRDVRSEEPREVSRAGSGEFSIFFDTYIFGKEWMSENESYRVGNLMVKKPCSFTTFDFSPKELVLANLYQNGKTVAENIKGDNTQEFFIKRNIGKTRFNVDFMSPRGNKSYGMEINFLEDSEIFNLLLKSVDSRERNPEIFFKVIGDYEEGNFPRSFYLKTQEGQTEVNYRVYGIENLINTTRREARDFWKNRGNFRDINSFNEYMKKYNSSELRLHKSG